jgi:hypothetical protein
LLSGVLFHVTERYRDRDPVPVYRRFREHGRMTPDGVEYVASWVTSDLARCFQVMEADSREALDAWMERWSDIVDFEVAHVVTSAEAEARVP